MSTQVVEFPSHERPRMEVNIIQMVAIATVCTIVWFILLGLTPISKGNFVRDLFLGSEDEQVEELIAKLDPGTRGGDSDSFQKSIQE